jgi:hypothetical protein
LRLSQPVAPGKKVKCPKCETVFAAPDEEPSDRTAVRDESEPERPRRRRADLDDDPVDDYPDRADRTRVRNRRTADEYAARAEQDHRDDDEEDLPRRRRPKRKQTANSNGLMAGILIGGVILLLGAGAIAAWVWPGFLRWGGVPAGTGNEDLLAYVPADYPFFMGADIDQLQAELGNAFPLNQWGAINQASMPDKMLFAMKFLPPFSFEMVMVMRTKVAYKEEDMRKSFQGTERQTAHGKVYYKVGKPVLNQAQMPGLNMSFLVGMPSDRIVIFANVSPKQMESLLAADGTKPSISGEALAIVQDVDKSTFWLAFHMNDTMKQLIAQVPGGAFAGLGPAQGIADALSRAKGIAAAVSLSGALKARLTLTCASADDALKVTNTLRDLWEKSGKPLVPQLTGALQLMGAPESASALKEACNALQFQNDGVKANATTAVPKTVLGKVAQEMQRLVQQMGGFGGFGNNMGGRAGMGGRPNVGGPPGIGGPPNMGGPAGPPGIGGPPNFGGRPGGPPNVGGPRRVGRPPNIGPPGGPAQPQNPGQPQK